MDGINECGTCQGIKKQTPAKIENASALSTIAYRVGTHSQFKSSMLASVQEYVSLKGLVNQDNDLATALFDAWSTIADVLTFYQERAVNEGFLRTAKEKKSILELARTIGYEINPGLAANTVLAFTLENSGSTDKTIIDIGTKVQSLPGQGEIPQVFETIEKIIARPEWNDITPRLTTAQDLGLEQLNDGDSSTVFLEGVNPQLKIGDVLLVKDSNGNFLLTVSSIKIDPLKNITQIHIIMQKSGNEIFTNPAIPYNGTLLKEMTNPDIYVIYGGAKFWIPNPTIFAQMGFHDADVHTVPDGILTSIPNVPHDGTLLKEMTNPDIYVIYGGAKFWIPNPTIFAQMGFHDADVHTVPDSSLLVIPSAAQINTTSADAFLNFLFLQLKTEGELTKFASDNKLSLDAVAKMANNKDQKTDSNTDSNIYAFRSKCSIFGHNAPRQPTLPDALKKSYSSDWDDGNQGGTTITQKSDRTGYSSTDKPPVIYLDNLYPNILPNTVVLLKDSDKDGEMYVATYTIKDVVEKTLNEFALNGKVTGLVLDDKTYDDLQKFQMRSTTVYAQSEELSLSEAPNTDPVSGDSIELDYMVAGLDKDQIILVTGELEGMPGVRVSEIASIKEITHFNRHTTLYLKDNLENNHKYKRDTVSINANVARATHGETKKETIGNGDPSQSHQQFLLKNSPLTYISDSSPVGTKSTLSVYVNDALWNEADSLYDLGPNDHSYIIRSDENGQAKVIFGDGLKGMRPFSGMGNIKANYRTGIGKSGTLKENQLSILMSRPLGVRSVTNPFKTENGVDSESLEDTRKNAPSTILTLGRLVSLKDFEDFAGSFTGIGKAKATCKWIGEKQIIHLVIASKSGENVDVKSTLYSNLVSAINKHKDPTISYVVIPFNSREFNISVEVLVDKDLQFNNVKPIIIDVLNEKFSFDLRQFGQSVTLSEVISTIQQVKGITAVNVTVPTNNNIAASDDLITLNQICITEMIT